MHKTRNLSRALSLVLHSASAWPCCPPRRLQPPRMTTRHMACSGFHYTAPDKEPVYLMVDYTDEENGGVAASHHCTSGATLEPDIVKATATTTATSNTPVIAAAAGRRSTSRC